MLTDCYSSRPAGPEAQPARHAGRVRTRRAERDRLRLRLGADLPCPSRASPRAGAWGRPHGPGQPGPRQSPVAPCSWPPASTRLHRRHRRGHHAPLPAPLSRPAGNGGGSGGHGGPAPGGPDQDPRRRAALGDVQPLHRAHPGRCAPGLAAGPAGHAGTLGRSGGGRRPHGGDGPRAWRRRPGPAAPTTCSSGWRAPPAQRR